ncbi:hypothetical protein K439DRAFT_1625192 [Ramaria rubella]|nr:hypothetical protein K439DRAFT_1625192 [Ramaria rubella]
MLTKISALFQLIAEFVSLVQAGDPTPWWLLSKSIHRKGQMSMLMVFNKPLKNVSYHDLMLYARFSLVSAINANQAIDSLAIQVCTYKPLSNAIFISLPQGGVDISFGPSLSNSEGSEPIADIEMVPLEDMTMPVVSDDESLPSARMSPLFSWSTTKSPGIEGCFMFLNTYIDNEVLWLFETMAPYAGLVQASQLFSYSISQYHAHDVDWLFESLFLNFITLCQLETLIEICQDNLPKAFGWGAMDYTKPPVMSIANRDLLVTVLDPYAQALHFIMVHLCCNYDCVYYDIWGLAQLRLDLQEHGNRPKKATREHGLDLQLDLEESQPSHFSEVLTLCYGYKLHGGTKACIDPMKLFTRPFGLHGLLENYIYLFFDKFLLDHLNYFDLSMLFCEFCEQVHNTIQAFIFTMDVTPTSSVLKLAHKVKELKVKPVSVPKNDNVNHIYST